MREHSGSSTCDESVRAVGFEPIGEEWPSVYIHEKLQLVLVVYVDDFKMAGPQKNLAQGMEHVTYTFED